MNTSLIQGDHDFTKNDENESTVHNSGYKQKFLKSNSIFKSPLLPKQLETEPHRGSSPPKEQGMPAMVSVQKEITPRRSKRKRIQDSNAQVEESTSSNAKKKVKNLKNTEAKKIPDGNIFNLVPSNIAENLDKAFFPEDMDTEIKQDILPKYSDTLLAKQTEFQVSKLNENDIQKITCKEIFSNNGISIKELDDKVEKQISKSEICRKVELNEHSKEKENNTTETKIENEIIHDMKNKMALEIKTGKTHEKMNKSITTLTQTKDYSNIKDEKLKLHNNNATTEQKNSITENTQNIEKSLNFNADESKYDDKTLAELYAEIKKADSIIDSLTNTKNKENCTTKKSPQRSPNSKKLESTNTNLHKGASIVVNECVKDTEKIKCQKFSDNLDIKSLKNIKEEGIACFENTETKNYLSQSTKMGKAYNSVTENRIDEAYELILSKPNYDLFKIPAISKDKNILTLENDKHLFKNNTDELNTGKKPMTNSHIRSNDNVTRIMNEIKSSTSHENFNPIPKKLTILYMSALEYEKENEDKSKKRNNDSHTTSQDDDDSKNVAIDKIEEESSEMDKQVSDITSEFQVDLNGNNAKAKEEINEIYTDSHTNACDEDNSKYTNTHIIQKSLKVDKNASNITSEIQEDLNGDEPEARKKSNEMNTDPCANVHVDDSKNTDMRINGKSLETDKQASDTISEIQVHLNGNNPEVKEKIKEKNTDLCTDVQDEDGSKTTNIHIIQESLKMDKQVSDTTSNKLNEERKNAEILNSKIQANLSEDKNLYQTKEKDGHLQLNVIDSNAIRIKKLNISSVTYHKSIDDDQLCEKENVIKCDLISIRNDSQMKNSQELEKMKLDINRISVPQSSNDASLYAIEELNKKQTEINKVKENYSIECLYNADKLITATDYLKLEKENLKENAKINMINTSHENIIQVDKNESISKEKTALYWDTEESFDMDDDFNLTDSQINMIEKDEYNQLKLLNETKKTKSERAETCSNTHFGLDSITVEIIDQLNHIRESVDSMKLLLNAVLMNNQDIKKKL